jgi:hypothetical protein
LGGSYGDWLTPVELGSAGGNAGTRPGGAGGGALRLIAGGTLRVDGTLKANGSSPYVSSGFYPGGGAGGSICVTAGTLSGSGSMSAGGASSGFSVGGGGAGGRIALYRLPPVAADDAGDVERDSHWRLCGVGLAMVPNSHRQV